MTAWSLLFAAMAAVGASDGRASFIQFGADRAQGVLVNLSPGAPAGVPAVGCRPTVVFVHGFNPMPRTVHFTMAEQVARALGRRFGAGCNVFSWDWNAATFVSLDPRVNAVAAATQGRALAAALCRAGAVPAGMHLIGHSSGCIVAASAARTFLAESGQFVAQLTLLEPSASYHPLVFERLGAGTAARRVENYWSADPSAYGRETATPGVENVRFRGPRPLLGMVSPRMSSHLYVVQWYITTIDDPNIPSGFNRSLIVAAGGP